MDDIITIAVSGVGAPLGQSITRACKISKRNYRVLISDLFDEASAVFPSLEFVKGVHFRSAEYLDKLIDMLNQYNVNLYYPGSEGEMVFLAQNKAKLAERTNCKLPISNLESLSIGMDKYLLTMLLRENSLPFAKTILLSEEWDKLQRFVEETGFPLVVKSRRSGPPFVVKNLEQLRYHYNGYDNAILQEYLGQENDVEITSGIFYTPEYGTHSIFTMERDLKYGLTWRGRYLQNPVIDALAEKVVTHLSSSGSINLQMKIHQGEPIIFEANMRCSSTTSFRAQCGWNEIDFAVDYFLFGRPPSPVETLDTSGIAVRYFDEVWYR